MDRRDEGDNRKPEASATSGRPARRNRNRGSHQFEWRRQSWRFHGQQRKFVRKHRDVHGLVQHILGWLSRADRKHRNGGIAIEAAPAHNVYAVREDHLTRTERELLLGPINLVSVAVRHISGKIFVQFHFMELAKIHVGVVGAHVRSAHGQLGFLHVRCATRHDRVGVHFTCFLHQDDGPSIDNTGTGSDDKFLRTPVGL
jgi:hypothetical protein